LQVAPTLPLPVRNSVMRFRFISTPSTTFPVLKGGFCVCVRSEREVGVKASIGGGRSGKIPGQTARTDIRTKCGCPCHTLSVNHRYPSEYPYRCSTTLSSTDIQADIHADSSTTADRGSPVQCNFTSMSMEVLASCKKSTSR